jgi:hypothetical protein
VRQEFQKVKVKMERRMAILPRFKCSCYVPRETSDGSARALKKREFLALYRRSRRVVVKHNLAVEAGESEDSCFEDTRFFAQYQPKIARFFLFFRIFRASGAFNFFAT